MKINILPMVMKMFENKILSNLLIFNFLRVSINDNFLSIS